MKTDKKDKDYSVKLSNYTMAKLYKAKANYIKESKLPPAAKNPSFDEIINWALEALLNAQERVMARDEELDANTEVFYNDRL